MFKMKALHFNIKKHDTKIILVLLVSFFASEVVTKLAYDFKCGFYNYSAIIKGSFALAILVYSLFNWDVLTKKIVLFLSLIFLIFIFGQFTFNDYAFGEHFFKNFIFFSRYIFVFILILLFSKIDYEIPAKVYRAYELIVIFNSILIVIGSLFEIHLFKTYVTRFGYNGIFMTPSTATYFYALALSYFGYKYFFYKQKLLELILVSIVCFLVGTKALLLFLFLTGIHVFIIKKLYKYTFIYFLATGVGAVFFIFHRSISIFFKQKFSILYDLYQEDGLITMLVSMRDKNFREDFIPLVTEKWNWINFLFGGTDFERFRVEFEILDVFVFFGFVGTSLYLWNYFTNVILFKNLVHFGKLQVLFLLITASLSGNFFHNAPLALYLIIVLGSIDYKRNGIN